MVHLPLSTFFSFSIVTAMWGGDWHELGLKKRKKRREVRKWADSADWSYSFCLVSWSRCLMMRGGCFGQSLVRHPDSLMKHTPPQDCKGKNTRIFSPFPFCLFFHLSPSLSLSLSLSFSLFLLSHVFVYSFVYIRSCVMEYHYWPYRTSAFHQRGRKEQEVHKDRKKLWSVRRMLGRITAYYKEGIFVSCIHSAHFTLHQSRYE